MISLVIFLFLLFAFFTVFLSIKLSYYADLLSKTSKVSKALIGGILLAGVTALPEFVTCLSAVFLANPALALGDVLGSNFFNIFIIAFFDLFFLKKFMFRKLSKNHYIVYILLITNYIFMYLFAHDLLSLSLLGIGLPSLIIFITYFIYVRKIASNDSKDLEKDSSKNVKNLPLKLFIAALLMVISSISLTFLVNKISLMYPAFSSSLIGAILLGITTSLPEVITFYTLITLNNYDLAQANIIGSNLFNLFVLGVSDFFLKGSSIYTYFDNDSLLILKLGILATSLCFIHHFKKFNSKKFLYLLPSLAIVFCYLIFWGLKFLR